MPRRRSPRNDVDEDVIHLGVGTILSEQYARRIHRAPKKNPIGFIWPKKSAKKRTRKRKL